MATPFQSGAQWTPVAVASHTTPPADHDDGPDDKSDDEDRDALDAWTSRRHLEQRRAAPAMKATRHAYARPTSKGPIS